MNIDRGENHWWIFRDSAMELWEFFGTIVEFFGIFGKFWNIRTFGRYGIFWNILELCGILGIVGFF